MLIAADVRNALNYNEVTGVFTWKATGRGRGRVAGAQAGSIKKSRGQTWRQITVNGHTQTSGYMAWLYVTGQQPKGVIERCDNDSLNDAFENLIDSDYSTVQKSRVLDKRSSTGIHGVCWKHVDGGFFAVSIGGRKTYQYLGRTRDFFEACCMRKSAENKLDYRVTY